MHGRTKWAALATVVLAAACGGGGGTGAGSNNATSSAFGTVVLLSHSPADGAVQVAVDAVLQFEFDAAMALETFGDEDTWLRIAGTTTAVPGEFRAGSLGRVTFTPSQPLLAETDYVCQLSALTSDQTGRILDVSTSFTFRTYDATPPTIASLDVQPGAQNQTRTRTFTATFSEAMGAASVTDTSVFLRDQFGTRYAASRTVNGSAVTLDPAADLPGDRLFTLVFTASVTDRAGNRLATASQTSFRTATDALSPSVLTAWPANSSTGISPRVQPTFTFDESMDPATVEAASLLFQDQFGSLVPFAIDCSTDQRTLRVRPTVTLQDNRSYTLAFLLGNAAATDVSGNALGTTTARAFTTGSDATAPALASSSPTDGETRVPGSVVVSAVFDEALDINYVTTANVTLTVDGAPWTAVVDMSSATTVRVTPVQLLPTGAQCVLLLRGGQDGLHDLAGNVLANDTTITFQTSTDSRTPGALLLPPDGTTSIATNSRVSVVFDVPMDTATLTASTVTVTDDAGVPIAGTTTAHSDRRTVAFTPNTPFAAFTYYRIRVLGGSTGARAASGNWLPTDRTARFRTANGTDSAPPSVTATVNGIQAARLEGLVLPPSGFTIDVTTGDSGSQWVDMGAIDVLLSGTGTAPGAATLRGAATISYGSLRVQMPAEQPLAEGNWTLSVLVRDLAGNLATSNSLAFTVGAATANVVPFERTQVVWVRTDLDRDGNGIADFDDDMTRLGLATAGDPIGTNATMRALLLDGVLAQSNHLYGRGSRGEPLDSGSVALRFTKRQPIGLLHTQMALGGYDPEGSRTRAFGDDSTGVLGRAYYDYRNGNPGERNTSTSPGLGIFPGEMFLYQAKIHQQVWPAYQTVFAQRFRPLCPAMGGTPAGSHALDAIVLSPNFDYATATTPQRARWQNLMDAADDWATVVGIILAHEVGHSVGLVAPGAAPSGLFGDSSLHDTYAGAAEVMAPSVGYEAMLSLEYQFRDIDLAYMRQRVLLR